MAAINFTKDLENIENYELAKADNFIGWECHHRLETHTSDGERRLVDISKSELIALGMYYNRPASELMFMRHSEHTKLHHLGRKCTVEHKMKTSNSLKGHTIPLETRAKISNTLKGNVISEETKEKLRKSSKTYIVAKLYKEYKAKGGNMSWNDFQKNNRRITNL